MKYQSHKAVTAIMLVTFAFNECLSMSQNLSANDLTSDLLSSCRVEVQEGAHLFRRKLRTKEPLFVQFRKKQVGNEGYNVSENVFEPLRWAWTFTESEGPYPHIFWNIDYGILSFNLLEIKSLYIKDEIILNVTDDCNLTYGSYLTTMKIAEAFIPLISVYEQDDPIYGENYFCQYQVNPQTNSFFGSFFINNVASIGYSCSYVYFNYTSNDFHFKPLCLECLTQTYSKLDDPYTLYIITFLFCLYCLPILLFSFAGWLEKNEKLNQTDDKTNQNLNDCHDKSENIDLKDIECNVVNDDDNWIYSDGENYPYHFSDVLNATLHFLMPNWIKTKCCTCKCNGKDHCTFLLRRLKRLALLLPLCIFLFQIYMYKSGLGLWNTNDKITITMYIDRGIPMGFLSLLDGYMRTEFVGSLIVLGVYVLIVAVFLFVPSSWKQIIENGINESQGSSDSTIFLTFSDTRNYSKLKNRYHTIPPGYANAIVFIQSRFYALFVPEFWRKIWEVGSNLSRDNRCSSLLRCISAVFFAIFYLICYSIPLISFLEILLKGLTKSKCGKCSTCCKSSNNFCKSLILVILVSPFVAVLSVLLLQNVLFLYQVFAYFLIAIILNPQATLQYLTFYAVFSYYVVELFQNFSNEYMEFLAMIIKVSQEIQTKTDHVYYDDGQVEIFSSKFKNIRRVKINGNSLDISEDKLSSIRAMDNEMVRNNNGFLGIPKALFHSLVQEFKPPHHILLPLILKAIIVINCVYALLNISTSIISGPANELSEAVGIITTIMVGTLPKLISSLTSHVHDQHIKEIQERQIEKAIVIFWEKKGTTSTQGLSDKTCV